MKSAPPSPPPPATALSRLQPDGRGILACRQGNGRAVLRLFFGRRFLSEPALLRFGGGEKGRKTQGGGPMCLPGVTLLRLERRTYCLEGSCSIQLSYRAVYPSGHPDSNWGSPAPKAGAITGLRYIPWLSCKKKRRLAGRLFWRRRGDSNPRYPNRVRQFSKLLVSATHPPLRVFF